MAFSSSTISYVRTAKYVKGTFLNRSYTDTDGTHRWGRYDWSSYQRNFAWVRFEIYKDGKLREQSQSWLPVYANPGGCGTKYNATLEEKGAYDTNRLSNSVSSTPAWNFKTDLSGPGTYTVKLLTCTIRDQTASPYYAGGDFITTMNSGPLCNQNSDTEIQFRGVDCGTYAKGSTMFPEFTMETFTVATATQTVTATITTVKPYRMPTSTALSLEQMGYVVVCVGILFAAALGVWFVSKAYKDLDA